MIEVTETMVEGIEAEIRSWLDGWKTPDDFADYCDDDRCEVALQILADCCRGIYIPRHVAEVLDIVLTDEDIKYDDGNEAVEEGTEKLAEQINAKLPADLPGSVYFGYMEYSGDYALMYSVDVDDLPYPA